MCNLLCPPPRVFLLSCQNDNDTYTVHFDSDDLDDNTEDFPAHCLMYDDGEESDE